MPPPGVHEFTPSKRGRILALHDENYPYRVIAEKVGGCSASAAWKTVKRDELHDTRNTLPRSGRPQAIDTRTKRHVLRELKKSRFTPYHAVAKELGDVTAHQVQSIAASAGYHRRIARRKPFLSMKAVQSRRAWAKENKDRDWRKIIWTDEAKIETGERPGHRHVTRLPGEEFLPKNIAPTFKSNRQSIMVWACITQNSKGPLIRLNMVPETTSEKGKKCGGGLNGPRYVDQVLSGPLKEFWQATEKEEGPGILVVEDGAPSHRSVVAKKARDEAGITNLTHPPSSPDLNPIEPIWLLLKNRVADTPGSANSLNALWNAIQKAWDGITLEDIQKHTNRMHDRVEAVERAKGWHTEY
jgi:hypothetical protein